MLADARAYLDLARRQDGFFIDAFPLGGYTDQVQYIGVDASLSPAMQAHAMGFVAFVLEQAQQQTLTALGALPACPLDGAPQYASPALQALYEAYKTPVVAQ